MPYVPSAHADCSRDGPVTQRIADPMRVVHRFYRSGTENLFTNSSSRSIEDLYASTMYLVTNVWSNTPDSSIDESVDILEVYDDCIDRLASVYGFIMDRLAAVRQDLTIHYLHFLSDEPNSLTISHSVSSFVTLRTSLSILVTIMRFYIHSEYVISRYRGRLQRISKPSSKKDDTAQVLPWFDISLHRKAFSATLAGSLAAHSKLWHHNDSSSHKNDLNTVGDEIMAYYLLSNQLDILQHTYTTSTRIIECIQNVSMSGNTFPQDFRRYPMDYANKSSLINFAWSAVVEMRRGNVAKIMKTVDVLYTYILLSKGVIHCVACLLSLAMPAMRISRLLIANRSANKSEGISSQDLLRRLHMSSSTDLHALCRELGLRVVVNEDTDGFSVYLNDPSVGNDLLYTSAWKVKETLLYDIDSFEHKAFSASWLIHTYALD